ncbi:protein disulfide isomerase-like 1-2 [Phtheirospermum japonicum]|uniref:Protein disulfide isomerase-like 1-2 n=1 Tax=Phtheirospermum japonicum TaxID=374723 RepID=A0A830DEC3_9LAMI|nr:protein disulfide isomerase-like 1-2 [Phtheirospermum japonicum]
MASGIRSLVELFSRLRSCLHQLLACLISAGLVSVWCKSGGSGEGLWRCYGGGNVVWALSGSRAEVGVFPKFSGEEFDNFMALAEKLRSDYDFGHTLDDKFLAKGESGFEKEWRGFSAFSGDGDSKKTEKVRTVRHGDLSPTRLPSLRKELLHFLLEDSSAPNSWAVTILPSNVAHANVLHLLELDTEATLEVLQCGFTEVERPIVTDSSKESTNFNMESAESQKLVQKVVDILAEILDASYFQVGSNDVNLVEVWPSKKDVDRMYDFIAYYVTLEKANVSRDILSQIFEYLTSEVDKSDTVPGNTIEILKNREKQLLLLLQVMPETDWDASYVLHLSEKAEFHQVL